MQYPLAFLAVAAAIQANPIAVPQAVTAAISPSAAPPPGCTPAYSGSFAIVAQSLTSSAVVKRQEAATQIADGQVQAPTYAPISQIGDGQVQAGTQTTVLPVTQISDGQIQAHTDKVAPISQISDGQPQAPTATVAPINQISDGQPQAPSATVAPINQISDGQPQAPSATVTPIDQISDGQPQAPTPVESTASAVSQISDAQPQAPTKQAVSQATDAQVSEATSASSANPRPASVGVQSVTCEIEGTLVLTLDNGILKDAQGRTGYIASNYQFQFDGPPQAGAIYTSGFSICENGTLALGGSSVFYQCLSGDFYNLYDRNWAEQCSPVTISEVALVKC